MVSGCKSNRRTQDKKKTFLHVLTSWAKYKEPDMLLLGEDLEQASEAAQWSLTDLKQQVQLDSTELVRFFAALSAVLLVPRERNHPPNASRL